MQDIRWKQRFENYLRAFQMLVEAVELGKARELSRLCSNGREICHTRDRSVLTHQAESCL